MKKALTLIVVCFITVSGFSQYIYKIKTDSLLVTNDSCTAELNLENSTRNIKGFLYNRGNGRTEFRRGVIRVNDSLYVIGDDTLNLGKYLTSAPMTRFGVSGEDEAANEPRNFTGNDHDMFLSNLRSFYVG